MIAMALWAISNWKVVLSGLVVAGLLALGTTLYLKGRSDVSDKIENAALRTQIAVMEHNQLVTNQLMKADAEQAEADAKELDEFDKQVMDLQAQLKEAQRICLDPPDVDGLRGLWGKGPKAKPPAAPK